MTKAVAHPTDLAAGVRSPLLSPPVPVPVRLASWLLPAGWLLLGWLALWNKLRADWSTNEQYGYGWFVPPLALVLLALRWADRPPPVNRPRSPAWLALLCGGALLLLLPVRLLEEPNPDWRLLFWVHAGLLTTLSLGFFAWTGGSRWLWHLAFPVGFLLLAIPWPSGPEQAVVQSLMRGVAAISAEGMNVLGIPAQPQGNLIHIRDQTVGVSEACSGIRSLQATLMAALLLGELARLSWARRAALIGSGVALALVANVFRSSLLVWIAARHGAAALEQVHDFAGFSVLVIVFVGLLGINRWLSPPVPPVANLPAAATPAPPTSRPRPVPTRFLIGATAALALSEVGTAAWYGPSIPAADQVASWTVMPPAGPGVKHLPIDSQTTRMLRYDDAVSARWTRPGPPEVDGTLFFFRWEAGHASGTLAEMHQPHICLTASGMTEVADWGVQPLTLPGGLQLPVRRYEFTLHGRTLYVFFVAWRDGLGGERLAASAGSRWDRLRAVAQRRANQGRQTLELVAVGPKSPQEADAWFEHEAAGLVRTTGASGRTAAR